MPECLRNLARQEVGETPDVRRHAVKQLRGLISDEPSLHFTTDEASLLIFLRARKYDVQSAFKTVKTYFKARRENPQIFDALSLHSVPFYGACRQHQLITLSRKTDPEGRAVLMIKFGTWNRDICSLNEFYRVGIVHLMHTILKEDFQIKGIVAVLDIKNLGPYHLAHYTPPTISKFLKLVQDCLPLRLKGVYIINNPAIFDLIFAIAKPLLKYKLVKRVRLFGYDLSKLHGLVPDDMIPEEYGGTHESYDYDEMERELEAREEAFQQWNSYGYREAELKDA